MPKNFQPVGVSKQGMPKPAATRSTAPEVGIVRFMKRPVAAEVDCPKCGSTHTVVSSQFGSTACKALYKCLDCQEPFDYFKPY